LVFVLDLCPWPEPVARAAGPAGWGHLGYDAEDYYYNPGEQVINASTIGSLTRRWTVRLRHQARPAAASPRRWSRPAP
jgi:hypothetical protein